MINFFFNIAQRAIGYFYPQQQEGGLADLEMNSFYTHATSIEKDLKNIKNAQRISKKLGLSRMCNDYNCSIPLCQSILSLEIIEEKIERALKELEEEETQNPLEKIEEEEEEEEKRFGDENRKRLTCHNNECQIDFCKKFQYITNQDTISKEQIQFFCTRDLPFKCQIEEEIKNLEEEHKKENPQVEYNFSKEFKKIK